ncbi:MAG: hypothetical protein DRP93_06065 [Candidatus Neomarinimicrobiota bacterium]|nr:MAG: hypothetical protein DRP93_06065 [Candidatus Neomarinimicrobiota bacterium]
MTEECIYMTIGYIVMFIIMVAAGKLYSKEADKNMKLELRYSDLLSKAYILNQEFVEDLLREEDTDLQSRAINTFDSEVKEAFKNSRPK